MSKGYRIVCSRCGKYWGYGRVKDKSRRTKVKCLDCSRKPQEIFASKPVSQPEVNIECS